VVNSTCGSLVCVVACHGMFAEFAESFSSASAQRELFEPLSRYEQICHEHVDMLQRLVSRSVPSHARSVDTVPVVYECRSINVVKRSTCQVHRTVLSIGTYCIYSYGLTLLHPLFYMGTATKHLVPDRVKPSLL